jgi:hypothetical protein
MPLPSGRPLGFSRHVFKAGERLMITSSCLACAQARIGGSSEGSVQRWEESHACASRDLGIRDSRILYFPQKL